MLLKPRKEETESEKAQKPTPQKNSFSDAMNYRLGVISCQYWQYALNSVLRDLRNLSKERDLYGSSNPAQMLSPFTICLPKNHQPYVKYLWHWILFASSGGSFCLPTPLTR